MGRRATRRWYIRYVAVPVIGFVIGAGGMAWGASSSNNEPSKTINCVTIYREVGDIVDKHPEIASRISTSGDPEADRVCGIPQYVKDLKPKH